jgi:elongation factor Ts
MPDDISKVKNLRDATGLSFGEIKKALTEAGGDEARALEIIKAKGGSMAAKKASREVSDGVVEAYVHSTKKVGALVQLLCETDFVAKNSEFQTLAKDIVMHITAMKPVSVEELLIQQFIKDPSITIQDLINSAIAKLGENIRVGQFNVFEI